MEIKRVAAIDIGTNTIRLLVLELTGEGKRSIIYEAGEITRLGEGMGEKPVLKNEAIRRSIDTLRWMVFKARDLSVSKLRACATSALREAQNRDEFLKLARGELDIEIEVLSGEQEAELIVQGVLRHFKLTEAEVVIFDLGGGSTEFIITSDSKIEKLLSLRLGVVSLAEKYLTIYPIPEKNIIKMAQEIGQYLKTLRSEMVTTTAWIQKKPWILIGTGGSATTLAGLNLNLSQYDAKRINGHILTLSSLNKLFKMLLDITPAERRRQPMIGKGREDIILAGTAIIMGIVKAIRQDQMTVSHAGLKEGIIAQITG